MYTLLHQRGNQINLNIIYVTFLHAKYYYVTFRKPTYQILWIFLQYMNFIILRRQMNILLLLTILRFSVIAIGNTILYYIISLFSFDIRYVYIVGTYW